MPVCSKCGRGHSGPICGIPPGISVGIRVGGAGLGGVRRTQLGPEVGHSKPRSPRPRTSVLEELLAQGRQQYAKVTEMLLVVPAEMPEYADLLDRESKLSHLLKQVEGQIAAARGAK